MKLLTKVHVKFRDTPDKNYVGIVVDEVVDDLCPEKNWACIYKVLVQDRTTKQLRTEYLNSFYYYNPENEDNITVTELGSIPFEQLGLSCNFSVLLCEHGRSIAAYTAAHGFNHYSAISKTINSISQDSLPLSADLRVMLQDFLYEDGEERGYVRYE